MHKLKEHILCLAGFLMCFCYASYAQIMRPPKNQDFLYYLYKNIYDLSYFIIITVIGLNVIFGIIVDTFSELRDSKVSLLHVEAYFGVLICYPGNLHIV